MTRKTNPAMIGRRAAMIAAAGLALPAVAQTNEWPTRPIRMVVPFPPGGGTDNLGRMFAQALGERLGQTVIVENRGGAGGNIGSAAVAAATPDGYTILLNGNGMAISKQLFKNPGYDWRQDFAWIARTASTPILLVVNDKMPVRNVQEFVTYARANPGKLNHGTAGAGTPFHLAAALFDEMAGTRMIHVPYRGTGPSVAGLLGNEVQLMFASSTAVDGLIRDGRIRVLANTAGKRSPGWPDVPSIAEALPGYAAELWYPLAAPARTPPNIVATLERATAAVMSDRVFAAALVARGFEPEYLDSRGVIQALEAEEKRWGPVIPRAGITAE
jgi:tripartite-type tricarboxylate transporter receptor subunit TctC